jgi:hypothetical protein
VALLTGSNTIVELLGYRNPSVARIRRGTRDPGAADVSIVVEDLEATVASTEANRGQL